MDKFEKGIERVVNGAFAKAFRSEVQPVEIASALRRECDDKAAIVGRERTIAPNEYAVDLGPADYERLAQWSDTLSAELGSVLKEHAHQQRYTLPGPVSVRFEQAEDLDTGLFRVSSATTRASQRPQHPSQPAGRPHDTRSGSPSIEFNGRTVALTQPVTVLGRTQDADVALEDTGASRRHAEVRLSNNGAQIVDLGSTNGTFVDGERRQVAALHEGSAITIGRTRLIFHNGYSSPGAGGSPGSQW